MSKIKEDVLQGDWIHSMEEDTDDEIVFRPADYDFPLSRRPRQSMSLKPDGNLVQGDAAESDNLDETPGTWKLDDDRLQIQYDSDEKPNQTLKIASIDDGKLVLKK